MQPNTEMHIQNQINSDHEGDDNVRDDSESSLGGEVPFFPNSILFSISFFFPLGFFSGGSPTAFPSTVTFPDFHFFVTAFLGFFFGLSPFLSSSNSSASRFCGLFFVGGKGVDFRLRGGV
jgi:hypothetical protein